ncbi:MAG: hypothetical protein SGILL_010222, partial [Bacillariaceae sp.]
SLAYNSTNDGTELQFDPIGQQRMEPPSDQRRGFRRWIPVGDHSERSRRWLRRERGLATKSDTSEVDDFIDDEDSQQQKRRRKKLCCINVCLCILVIAAIICSVLLALEFSGRNDKNAETEADSNAVAPTPSPPVESPTFTLPSSTPEPTIATSSGTSPVANSSEGDLVDESGTTTDSPASFDADSVTGRDPVASPSESGVVDDTPTSGSNPLSPSEARIVEISGDAIYNSSTPQYAAYDWLQNEDPANLDLDNIPEHDLTQRY